MTSILELVFKGFWCGCAATGFAILFNAPLRTLLSIWICGFIAGFIKFFLLDQVAGVGIIPSTFVGSVVAGFCGIPLANYCRVPVIIVMLPSVIPLVPGFFAYRTMMGIMSLTRHTQENYSTVLSQTVFNGLTTLLVIVAIAIGLILPNLLFGTESLEKTLMRQKRKKSRSL